MDWLSNEILFSHALWTGLYSGLYSVSKKGMVPHPTDQCLGQWIVDDLVGLKNFKDALINDFIDTPISEYQKSWYSFGDLMFKNFDACNFKLVMNDVKTYCLTEVVDSKGDTLGACESRRILENMQSNVFALITQASALAATFQQEGWQDQAAEDKAYSFQQLGHTLGQFYVDLTGFKPTILH